MRLLLALLAANLLMFGIGLGYLDPTNSPAREPYRLSQQVGAEKLRLIPAAKNLSEQEDSQQPQITDPVCRVFFGLTTAQAERIDSDLRGLGIEQIQRGEVMDDQSLWMVYHPPLRDRGEANRRLAELRRRGISDIFLILDDPALRLGISVGTFRNQEAAHARLTNLGQQGVATLRIREYKPGGLRVWLRVTAYKTDLNPALDRLLSRHAGISSRSCTLVEANQIADRNAERSKP